MSDIVYSLQEVFRCKKYIMLSLFIACLILTLSILIPNVPLVLQLLLNSTAPVLLRAKIIVSLIGGIRTNFTFITAFSSVLISILFGIYVSLYIYNYDKRKEVKKVRYEKTGILGILSGILGIGCSSCGSVLLSLILSFSGAVSFLIFLPLKGLEFSILSIFLLLISIFTLSSRIKYVNLCRKGGEVL